MQWLHHEPKRSLILMIALAQYLDIVETGRKALRLTLPSLQVHCYCS